MKSLIIAVASLVCLSGCNQYEKLLDREIAVRENAVEYAAGCIKTAIEILPGLKDKPENFLEVASACVGDGVQFVATERGAESDQNAAYVSGCLHVTVVIVGRPKSSEVRDAILSHCAELLKARQAERETS